MSEQRLREELKPCPFCGGTPHLGDEDKVAVRMLLESDYQDLLRRARSTKARGE